MFYKNVSLSEKTFYGVNFKPGETKEVDGYINNLFMIRVEEPEQNITKEPLQEPAKQQKPSSDKSKKGEEKKVESDSSVETKVTPDSTKQNS